MTDNIVVNADYGIYFGGSDNPLVANNTLFGNRRNEIKMTEHNAAGELYVDRLENNVFFPLAYRETLYLESYFDNDFANFSNNRYALVHKNTLIYESYNPTGLGTTERALITPPGKISANPMHRLLHPSQSLKAF